MIIIWWQNFLKFISQPEILALFTCIAAIAACIAIRPKNALLFLKKIIVTAFRYTSKHIQKVIIPIRVINRFFRVVLKWQDHEKALLENSELNNQITALRNEIIKHKNPTATMHMRNKILICFFKSSEHISGLYDVNDLTKLFNLEANEAQYYLDQLMNLGFIKVVNAGYYSLTDEHTITANGRKHVMEKNLLSDIS